MVVATPLIEKTNLAPIVRSLNATSLSEININQLCRENGEKSSSFLNEPFGLLGGEFPSRDCPFFSHIICSVGLNRAFLFVFVGHTEGERRLRTFGNFLGIFGALLDYAG